MKTRDGFEVGFDGHIVHKSKINKLNNIINDYSEDFVNKLTLLEILHMIESDKYETYQEHLKNVFKSMGFKIRNITLKSVRAKDNVSGSNAEIKLDNQFYKF